MNESPSSDAAAIDRVASAAGSRDPLDQVTDLDVAALASRAGVFRGTAADGVLRTNERFAEVTGLAAHTLGWDWLVAVHAEDRDRLRRAVEAACATGARSAFTIRMQVALGRIESLRLAVTGVAAGDGTYAFVGSVEPEPAPLAPAMHHDAEQPDGAREPDDPHRVLLDALPIAVAYVAPDGTIDFVNDHWSTLTDIGVDGRVDDVFSRFDDEELVEALATATAWRGLATIAGCLADVDVTPVAELLGGGALVTVAADRAPVTGRRDAPSSGDAPVAAFAALLDASSDYAAILEPDGGLIYLNAPARALFDLDADADLAAIDLAQLVEFGGSDAGFNDTARDAVRESGVHLAHGDLLFAGGGRLRASLILLALTDSDGVHRASVCVARDETELEDAEERVAERERWYRALVQNAADVVAVLDEDLTVRFASPTCRQLLGVEPEDLMGIPRVDLVHPEDVEAVKAGLHAVRDGATDVTVRYRFCSPDGLERVVESTISNRFDDSVIHGLVMNTRDVTEAARANRAREDSEAALRTVVRSAPAAIFAVDRDGVVQLWNPACEALFGWPATEVVGGRLPFLSDGQHQVISRRRDELLAGRDISGEATFKRRDGTEVTVVLSAASVTSRSGSMSGVVTVAVDVTDRVRADRDLSRRAETDRLVASMCRVLVEAAPESLSDDVTGILEQLAAHYGAAAAALHVRSVDRATYAWPQGADLRPDAAVISGAGVFVDDGLEPMAGWAIGGSQGPLGRVTLGWAEAPDIEAADLEPLETVGAALIGAVDRVEAERSVRDSESRFRGLVQNLAEGVTVLAADGSVKYSSPSAARMMGFEPDHGMGMVGLDFVVAEDRERAADVMARAFAEPGIQGPITLRVHAANDVIRVVEALGHNRLDDPEVNGVVITIRDITARVEAEEAARRSDRRLSALVQNLSDVITVVDPDGQMIYTSPAAYDLFGFVEGDESYIDPMSRVHPDDQDYVMERLGEHVAGRSIEPVRFRIKIANGEWRDVEAVARDMTHEPAVGGIVVTTRDVTERTRAESLVTDQQRILTLIARGSPLDVTLAALCEVVERHVHDATCGVVLVDPHRNILRLSAGPRVPPDIAEVCHNVPVGGTEDVLGVTVTRGVTSVVLDVAHDPRTVTLRDAAAANGVDGVWTTPVFDSDGVGVLGTIVNLFGDAREPTIAEREVVQMFGQTAAIAIERQMAEDLLAHRANHDLLTGLPNRGLFVDFLANALARTEREDGGVAVLFLDLDRFKHVNDGLGHEAGDSSLRAIAQRLSETVRPSDVVARFGGDEFTVLCDRLDPDNAEAQARDLAQRLLEVIEQPLELDGEDRRISASMGIAVATPSSTPEGLLHDADAAMYEAKQRGKARIELFDDGMRSTLTARLDLEARLERAIEREEFRLVVQPIVDLPTGRCVAAEALVRWQDPEFGLVTPDAFIGLAEDTGLILPIGEWVLAESCRTIERWEQVGLLAPEFTLSVNLSARQVGQAGLVDRIRAILEAGGTSPSRICLEITESVLMEESSAAAMRELKDLGVSLSIDDFGTGYSSLGYLKKFPVDSVKVDRSFVDGLGIESEDSAIVAAVVSLGHALGLSVVAEGVETSGQLHELLALGCDRAQGYWFSGPRDPTEFAGLLHAQPWAHHRVAWAS